METLWSFWRLFTVFVRWDQTSLRCFCPVKEAVLFWVLWAMSWVLPGFSNLASGNMNYSHTCVSSMNCYTCSFLVVLPWALGHSFTCMPWSVLTWRFERNSLWTYGIFCLCSPLFAATLLWVLATLTSLNCQLDLNPRRLPSYLGSSS